jgi:hypothetical protein
VVQAAIPDAPGLVPGPSFSVSAAPNGRHLRFTVKDPGSDTKRLQRTSVGTRVFLEGPTATSPPPPGPAAGPVHRRRDRHHATAGPAGGLAAPGDDLIYRATRHDDVVFRKAGRAGGCSGATIHYLVGKQGSPEVPTDPNPGPAPARAGLPTCDLQAGWDDGRRLWRCASCRAGRPLPDRFALLSSADIGGRRPRPARLKPASMVPGRPRGHDAAVAALFLGGKRSPRP